MNTILKRAISLLIAGALCGSIALNCLLYQQVVDGYRDVQIVRLDPTRSEFFVERNRLQPAPVPGNKRAVFFGDSRIEMWRPLPAIDGIEIVNRGSGGETTAQALLRLERDVLALDPDLVVIQLGINDLKSVGVLPGEAENITRRCRENIELIADKIAADGRTVLLLTIFPVGPVSPSRWPVWSDDTLEAAGEVNRWLGTLSKPRVHVLNCDPVLSAAGRMKPPYALDALHMTSAGYASLNELVIPELTALAEGLEQPGNSHGLQ